MNISTTDITSISPYFRQITAPQAISHKGQNGKVLVIGGSSLFHGAVLWAAEAASHIVDMVHVVSTIENNGIIQKIKTMWQTGIVIAQKDIPHYAQEDSVILIGNGMMRSAISRWSSVVSREQKWEEILKIKDEGEFTRELTHYLITHFPEKQFVIDAGALQMMDVKWLNLLHKKAIITPHQKEFQTLFGTDITSLPMREKERLVSQKAQEYNCIILLKAIEDIVSDGSKIERISGGNAGLTKGGTGDILAGLVAGISASSDPFVSSVCASFLLKETADTLFKTKGYWYSPTDILSAFPGVFHAIIDSSSSLT
jgi:NAD(P)H-hydrate epimerase